MAVLHGNRQRAIALGHMLKAAGHTISVVEEGPNALRELRDASPDLILGASSYGVTGPEDVVRALRRSLERDVFLLLVQGREDAVPPTDADDIIREPVDPRELNLRVRLALRNEAEKRRLQARNEELAGLSQGSWIHSLAGGAEALFGQLARHAAVTLRAEKGLVLLLDSVAAHHGRAAAGLRRHSRRRRQGAVSRRGRRALSLELPDERAARDERRPR